MKKIILILTLLSMNVYADPELSQVELEDLKQTLKSEGFNTNGSVVIVPESKINAPHDLKRQWQSQAIEQKEKGYYTKEAPRVKELLQMHNTIDFEYVVFVRYLF